MASSGKSPNDTKKKDRSSRTTTFSNTTETRVYDPLRDKPNEIKRKSEAISRDTNYETRGEMKVKTSSKGPIQLGM